MDYKKLVEHLVISGAGNPNNIFDDAATAITELLERAEKAERERDAAVQEWQGFCIKCAWNGKQYLSDGKMDDRCRTCRDNQKCNWEWRGIKED